MSKNVTLHRKNLYDEVWAEPMSRLAPKYGLSGNGLKKICKKLNIPVPPRGYWARLQHGYKVKKTLLTKLKAGVPETYTLQGNTHKKAEKGSTPEDILSPEALELIEAAQSKTDHVSVPLRLASPQPLIQKTQIELKKVKPDEYGMLRPWRKNILSVRVSPESMNRALRIMQAVLRGLKMLGLQVTVEINDYNRYPVTYLHIFDERFEIILEEKSLRSDHVPTEKEKKEMERWSYYSPKKWDYTPTGKLSLRYAPWGSGHDGLRKTWRDTVSKKLEDQLTDFIIGGIKIGDAMRRERIRRQEEDRLRHEEYLKWEEAERQRKLESERLHDLEKQAGQWHKSQKLKEYITEVEKAAVQQRPDKNKCKKIDKWLDWANKHAESINPLTGGLPMKLY